MKNISKDELGQSIPEKRMVAAITPAGRGALIECDIPEVAPGFVLIRACCSMISAGTHLGNVKNLRAEPANKDDEPTQIGYQSAGEVIRTGSNVSSFAPGDRVCCFGGEAVHSQWIVVPQNLCAKIPDNVNYEEVSGINLVLTAMHALRRAKPEFGERMLVVGMGVVGQLLCQLGHAAGLNVMAWDLNSYRLQIAKELGTTVINPLTDDAIASSMQFTNNDGFDIAVLAMGGDGTNVLAQVSDVMRKYPDGHKVGRIVFPGGLSTLCKWGAQGLDNLDLLCSARTGLGYKDKEWEKGDYEYPKSLVRWTTESNLNLALQWIEQGIINIPPLITKQYTLGQIDEAIDLLVDDPEHSITAVLTMP